MAELVQKKHSLALHVARGRNPAWIKQVLRATSGLWRGRKINPIVYQRSLRKSYSTLRSK